MRCSAQNNEVYDPTNRDKKTDDRLSYEVDFSFRKQLAL